MSVGGNKGLLSQVFCFKVVVNNFKAYREYQVLIAVYQIFIILLLIDILPPPFIQSYAGNYLMMLKSILSGLCISWF